MKLFRIVLIVAMWALAGPVLPQTGERASTPPGASQDGSRPADGAIKGGSIVPGESSGVPTDRQVSRCADLTGTLREQCLAQDKGAAAGGTMPPDPDVVKPPTTREAPPPQNPQPRSN